MLTGGGIATIVPTCRLRARRRGARATEMHRAAAQGRMGEHRDRQQNVDQDSHRPPLASFQGARIIAEGPADVKGRS